MHACCRTHVEQESKRDNRHQQDHDRHKAGYRRISALASVSCLLCLSTVSELTLLTIYTLLFTHLIRPRTRQQRAKMGKMAEVQRKLLEVSTDQVVAVARK